MTYLCVWKILMNPQQQKTVGNEFNKMTRYKVNI